jgi:hypothetical protein
MTSKTLVITVLFESFGCSFRTSSTSFFHLKEHYIRQQRTAFGELPKSSEKAVSEVSTKSFESSLSKQGPKAFNDKLVREALS